jgi:hypothetical protein
MKKIYCLHCDTESKIRLTNGKYWCGHCNKSFSVTEARSYLVEKIKEIEWRVLQKECVLCGRQLSSPKWCSWCNSEPKSGEYIISELRESITAIEAEIAEGEPPLFKKARAGDKESIAIIFKEVFEIEPWKSESWKSLVGLGAVAVEFLITSLKTGKITPNPTPDYQTYMEYEVKPKAAKALGEIGDLRALAPLIEAIKSEGMDTAILETIDKIATSHTFLPLLNKLKDNYDREYKVENTVAFRIVNILNRILERSAVEIPENALIAASKIKDVPARLIRQSDEELKGEDAWGYFTYRPTYEIPAIVDCSSLRQAAQQEIRRRGLILDKD